MLNDYVVAPHVDLLNNETEYLLAILHRERLSSLVESGKKGLEVLRQSQVRLFVVDLSGDPVELGFGSVRPFPEPGDP